MSNKQVVIKDENVSTAIEEGLKILEATEDEVEIEIIEKGKSGFLGVGSRLAKVQLTLNEEKKDFKNEEESSTNKKSKIKVESDSEVKDKEEIVTIEDNNIMLNKKIKDKYPIIKGDQRVNLYLNSELIEESIIISEDDNVKVQTVDKKPISEIDVRVTEDKLKAFLKVNYEVGAQFSPKIMPPSGDNEILITTEKKKEIEPKKFSLDDLHRKLDELDIVYGIQKEALRMALENPGEEFLVAQGDEPKEGIDAKIEYLFEENGKSEIPEDADRIDYFSLDQVTSVEQGEVIAKKHPLKVGKAGMDVYGNEIEVEAPQDIQWKYKDGVQIIGDKAVATRAGRPIVKGEVLFVIPTYIVNGDVDASEGNIDFDGDVVIKKNINENFSVKAGGKIVVYENVNQAYLEAAGVIDVKGNIIGSEIVTGKLAVYYENATRYLSKVAKRIGELKKAIAQLKNHKSFKTKDLEERGDKQIIQLLLDTKYKMITELLVKFYELSEEINQEEVVDELVVLLNELKEKINKYGACKINNIEELSTLKEEIEDVCSLLNRYSFEDADIKTSYVQNSELKANGSILIKGQGGYNSNLDAGKKVIISGRKGVFRGGKIRAHDKVFVKELGSPGVSKVEVYVSEEARIISDKVYVNVLINIGGRKHRFQKVWVDMSACLDDKGIISIT
ncbi:FapA family protein [Sporohalobacter salinus]|uniref:FapA family protein n=1 Tax=Sporohalobacter salinus TaxID=1494606 RepID=UPI00196096F1|nr:FapA family protein [Sporohalobacter salinus]MBM7622555.1 uncharacterized protein (DUF342 family) [Sporohalobacter salinus]